MSSMPTVWILGAGFSQALGAPLFRDLFQSEERIDNSGYQVHPHTTNVLLLYRRFGPRLEGREGRGQVWRNPEEFIDFIESAKSASGGAREFLEGVIGGVPVDLIADIARRMLAIECSIFPSWCRSHDGALVAVPAMGAAFQPGGHDRNLQLRPRVRTAEGKMQNRSGPSRSGESLRGHRTQRKCRSTNRRNT